MLRAPGHALERVMTVVVVLSIFLAGLAVAYVLSETLCKRVSRRRGDEGRSGNDGNRHD